MVVNIYDTANDMSRQLVETQEYQGLKKALDELKADSEAFESFKKFQKMQASAQQNQERQIDQMLQQLNKTITSPIQDLYSDIMPNADEEK